MWRKSISRLNPTVTLHITRRSMALHQGPDASKLIFAPSGSSQGGQAEQFTKGKLNRKDLDPDSPIPQFHNWFSEAQSASEVLEKAHEGGGFHAEACALSTAHLPSGRVSSRMVYLKELDRQGNFVIYSNWGTSRKARDIETNPHASLLFFWEEMQRQVRVEGTTEKLSPQESQHYFNTRAKGSRIGAWASRQSAVLEPEQPPEASDGQNADDGRKQLEGWVKEVEERFKSTDKIPVPDFWGGMRIIPSSIEFWQGRDSRLHDRFIYTKVNGTSGSTWDLKRLSP